MRRYTFAFSIAAHLSIAGVLMLSPALSTDMLPVPRRALAFIDASARLPAPSIAPPRPARSRPAASPAAAPTEAPDAITPETGFEQVAEEGPGTEGVPDGVPGGPAEALAIGEPLPPPPPPPPAEPVRVGGSIEPPQKTREVAPVYPAIAQAARVQGIVILEAVIGEDGRVRNLRVLRSIPLLDQAALDAVRQWQFTPTLLNGEPVPVVMTVTVAFQLRE